MAGKQFDISKFRKGIAKSIPGMSIGFRDPKIWISTGNYCLNYLISGRFDVGIPLGKVSIFAGAPGAGKSLVVSGNLIKNAQSQGIYCILIDSENALDETWLQALGVDTSEEKLLKLNMAMINDVAKMISDFVKEYRNIPEDERPKILFVVDSLGMLLTPTMVDQMAAGDLKGDLGIKAKQLKALITNTVNMFGDLDIGLVCTNHIYSSQDKYTDDIISGGCLTAGHKIVLSDGSSKPIEDMKVGDCVQTLEGVNNVVQTYSYLDKEVFELQMATGDIIQATGEHRFLVKNEDGFIWKKVADLSVDDEIFSA
jgi:RecA/RadA recombinase